MTDLRLLQVQGLLESAIEHQSIDALEIAKDMVDRMLNEKSMTVREAFSKAFGEVPEGATCHFHMMFRENMGPRGKCEHIYGVPMLRHEGFVFSPSRDGGWAKLMICNHGSPYPDISDRSAEAFLGFFGEKYDKVVQP